MSVSTDNSQQPLIVRPYEWVSKDFDNRAQVRIWCLTRSDNDEEGVSRQICVRVEDFMPTLRVELPTLVEGAPVDWSDKANLKKLIGLFDSVGGSAKPVSRTIAARHRIYFNLEVMVVTMRFKSERDLLQYRKAIEVPIPIDKARGVFVEFKIWETSITTTQKLTTQRNLGYTQWMSIDVNKCRLVEPDSQISLASAEYVVPYEELQGISEDITASWQVNPMTLTLDIECYSPNHNTVPKGIYADNAVTMNSLIFQLMYPDKAGSRRMVKILQTTDLCDDIPDAAVRFYKHEIQLIMGMQEYIRKYNPFVVYTFNGFKFDFPYLDERREIFSVDKWNNLSCLQDDYSDTKILNMSWHSSAQQSVIIKSLEMEGRLSLDVYRIMRADYPQLPQHSLEALSRQYLKKGKHPVSAQEMFRIHERSVKASAGLAVAKAAVLSANQALAKAQAGVEVDRAKLSLTKASSQLKSAEAASSASKKEVARVGSYCLQDSLLTFELPDKLNLFSALMEMSNIVCVPPAAIYTRGQQVRVRNQIYKEVFDKGFILNDPGVKVGKYAGGYVCPPVKGRHRNVMVFDFASLYPSIIRAYNMCYTTLVTDETVPDINCNVIEWDEEHEVKETAAAKKARLKAERSEATGSTDPNYKPQIIKTHFRYRFLKKEIRAGVLPLICEKLVNKRNYIKGLMKNPELSKFLYSVYDQRQNALKICANSVYGFLGAQTMPLEAAASSVTAKGRILNFICQNYVKKYGGQVVYGDTDSIMVSLPFINIEETYEWGNKLAAELTALFPTPLKLEFEKSYQVVIYFTKKRYAGIETKYYELEQVTDHTVRQTEIGPLHTFKYTDKKTGEVKEYNVISELDKFNKTIAGMLIDETVHYNTSDYKMLTCRSVANGYLHSLHKDHGGKYNADGTFADGWTHVLSQHAEAQQVVIEDKKSNRNEATGGVRGDDDRMTASSKTVTAVTGFAVAANGDIDIDLKKVKHRGLANTRRDRCPWAQTAFATCLRSALLGKGLDVVLAHADDNIFDMMHGLVASKELVLTREVNNYKETSNCPMKVFKQKQEERGHPLELGERVAYLFVNRVREEDNTKQGYKMCLLADYVQNKDNEPIDRIFYVEKQLCKPIEQLLQIVYGQELADMTADLKAFGYKPKNFFSTRLGINYITVWVKVIKRKETNHQELLYDFDNGIINMGSGNGNNGAGGDGGDGSSDCQVVQHDKVRSDYYHQLNADAWLWQQAVAQQEQDELEGVVASSVAGEDTDYISQLAQQPAPEGPVLDFKRRTLIHPVARVDFRKMLGKLDEVKAMTGVVKPKKTSKTSKSKTVVSAAVNVQQLQAQQLVAYD